jgi:hypothetical protein
MREKEIADHEAQNGVAEELEGLVVADVVVAGFVGVGLVRDGACEEVTSLERVSDASLELG